MCWDSYLRRAEFAKSRLYRTRVTLIKNVITTIVALIGFSNGRGNAYDLALD